MIHKKLLLSFLIFPCFVFSQQVKINGIISEILSQDSIVLKDFSSNPSIIQSTAIQKPSGVFNLSASIPYTGFYRLGFDDKNFILLLLKPGENITIEAKAYDLFSTSKVEGSTQTSLFYRLNDQYSKFQFLRDSIQRAMNDRLQELTVKEEEFAYNFVMANSNSLASLMLVDKINKDVHMDAYLKLDSALSKDYPNNPMVNDFHAEIQKMSFLKIGSTIPEIVLKDKDGKETHLSKLRGKVVLVDFWATWCGPCKAEIPNMKKQYETYKNMGFEIYSVSLDRQKEAWINGSTDLPWVSVFDEGGVVANQFQVASIPFMLLIDKEGTILAKNVRGAELKNQLEKIFNK
mgnify:CR=1 FL=1